MADEDNGDTRLEEFHETSDSPAPVTRASARARD